MSTDPTVLVITRRNLTSWAMHKATDMITLMDVNIPTNYADVVIFRDGDDEKILKEERVIWDEEDEVDADDW